LSSPWARDYVLSMGKWLGLTVCGVLSAGCGMEVSGLGQEPLVVYVQAEGGAEAGSAGQALVGEGGAGDAGAAEAAACSIWNCSGCCEGSTCIVPTSDTFCGASGTACLNCQSYGLSCVAGACAGKPAPCSPASCPTGCCDSSGVCQAPGNSTCGTGGGACSDCTLKGESCSGGVCQ
jgi:hypothetical protein